VHFAHETRPGKPDIEVIEFFDAPNLDVFLTLANTVAQTHSMQGPARDAVPQGAAARAAGLFRNLVETGTGQLNSDIGKVFQAKCLVREQFADPELAVHHIAEVLGCSADYLSHLYHVETKDADALHPAHPDRGRHPHARHDDAHRLRNRLRQRLRRPGVFRRVFKQHKGMTPHEYRAQLESHRVLQEGSRRRFTSTRGLHVRRAAADGSARDKPGDLGGKKT